jgi:hypothetical protein
MKLKFVLLGPEDDPDGRVSTHKNRCEGPSAQFRTLRYEEQDTGMFRLVQLQNGPIRSTPVANFTARIVRDITIDDGQKQRREFGVEAELKGQRIVFTVSGAEFGRMGWVFNRLGPGAIIYPSQQQHARAAIQSLSGEIRQECVIAHLGWRKEGHRWIYLHAGGGVDAAGAVSGVHVRVPAALQAFQTQPSLDSSAIVHTLRASLRCLSVAPDRITLRFWQPSIERRSEG